MEKSPFEACTGEKPWTVWGQWNATKAVPVFICEMLQSVHFSLMAEAETTRDSLNRWFIYVPIR